MSAGEQVAADAVRVNLVHDDIDNLNQSILDALEAGKRLATDARVTLTPEAFAAGALVVARPQGTLPDGSLDPSKPYGRIERITQEEWETLQSRLEMLGNLIKIFETPDASKKSIADRIRGVSRRWRTSAPGATAGALMPGATPTIPGSMV